ncbi:MAG TPA: 30S ribosomal protein S16 [Candidatus Bipolaricaulota bacterium]|nr:30S ribosomal protein S16 [Candidatus Bipolaricaulota bacterium]
MLKIILSRIGKKHQPFYRITVLEKSKDPWGNYLEKLGHYNPRTKEIKLNAERIKHWIANGAQPSATVHNLLVKNEIISGKKVSVTTISKKRQAKMAAKKAESAAKEEAAKPAAEIKEEAPAVEDTPKAEQTETEKK